MSDEVRQKAITCMEMADVFYSEIANLPPHYQATIATMFAAKVLKKNTDKGYSDACIKFYSLLLLYENVL